MGIQPIRRLTALSIAVLALAAAGGCALGGNYAARPVEPALLPAFTLRAVPLGQPRHDADGYDVSLGFELRAADEFDYNAVVQEIVQEVIYTRFDGRRIHENLVLVEAFQLRRVGRDETGQVIYRLPSLQRDRHFERGYSSVGPAVKSIEVWRVVRCYAAYVEGADWTDRGFAHLPQNRDAGLRTAIPPNFNESHQRSHEVRGRVLQDVRDQGRWYHMRYRWARGTPTAQPVAEFAFVMDARPPDESEWVAKIINNSQHSAGAGE